GRSKATCPLASSNPSAIGRSKPLASFLRSAGADLPSARVRTFTNCTRVESPGEVVRGLRETRQRSVSGSMILARSGGSPRSVFRSSSNPSDPCGRINFAMQSLSKLYNSLFELGRPIALPRMAPLARTPIAKIARITELSRLTIYLSWRSSIRPWGGLGPRRCWRFVEPPGGSAAGLLGAFLGLPASCSGLRALAGATTPRAQAARRQIRRAQANRPSETRTRHSRARLDGSGTAEVEGPNARPIGTAGVVAKTL